jgi:hypothetical protein
MKKVFSVILAGICMLLPRISNAQPDANAPMMCDESKKLFDLLKKKRFAPVLLGESDNVQTAVFLNADRDMIIAFTSEDKGKHITCLIVGGEKNTHVFQLPQESNQDQKL